MDVQPAAGPVRGRAGRHQAAQPVPGRRQPGRARQAPAAAGRGHLPPGHAAAGGRGPAAHPAARDHAVGGRVTLRTYRPVIVHVTRPASPVSRALLCARPTG